MIPKRILWLLDVLAMVAAALLADALLRFLEPLFNAGGLLQAAWIQRLRPPNEVYWRYASSEVYLWIVTGIIPPAILCLGLTGNHLPPLKQSGPRIFAGCLVAPLAGLSLASLVLFSFKVPAPSRFVLVTFALCSSFTLGAYRLGLLAYFRLAARNGIYASKVLLVGYRKAAEKAASVVEDPGLQGLFQLAGYIGEEEEETDRQEHPGLQRGAARNTASAANSDNPVALLEPPFANSKPEEAKLKRLGDFSDLRNLLNNYPIHEVVMTLPRDDKDWVVDVIDACDELGVKLRVVPDALLLRPGRALRASRFPGDLPLPGALFVPVHYHAEALFFKRCLDFAGAALLLLLLSPIMAIVAILVKITDPKTPTIYGYQVVGKNGVPFRAYKFRTMVPNADKLKEKLLGKNEMTGPVFKMKNDPRVTKLGRFLRKFSLDELPQLWNVLRGDLSLVGPRAPGPHELQRYEFWHKRRLSIKPGLTCLWQIRGRNKVNHFDEWVSMDLEYIDNWSLWLDFKILLLTIPAVLKGTGQ